MEKHKTQNFRRHCKTRAVSKTPLFVAILFFFNELFIRIKEESCKPLQLQLNDIQNSLTKQEEEILNIRSKILRNGSQIKQKISMQIEN